MLTERLRTHKEWLAIVSLAVLAAGIWCRALEKQDTSFRATFLDVGEGDAILLQTPSGRTILVDGGGRSNGADDVIGSRVVAPFLRRQGVNRIDLVVLTHPHDDHVQGLVRVLKDFRVGMVLDPGIPHASRAYRQFLSLVKTRRIPYRRAACGQVIDFGDGIRAYVLHPPPKLLAGTEDDINNNSVVLRLTYGRSALMLTGDAGVEAERRILASGMPIRSDVLKVAHHGSESSTSDEWLDAVRPQVAVISTGRNNPSGHPTAAVMGRLAACRAKVYRTDRHGAVTVRFSKGALSVQTVAPADDDGG